MSAPIAGTLFILFVILSFFHFQALRSLLKFFFGERFINYVLVEVKPGEFTLVRRVLVFIDKEQVNFCTAEMGNTLEAAKVRAKTLIKWDIEKRKTEKMIEKTYPIVHKLDGLVVDKHERG